jgi:nucleotide-binding universal stress UspA family protein
MTTRDSFKIDNVLVPLDFSRASLKAIDYALALVSRFGAKLNFVHVLDYDYPLPALAMMGGCDSRCGNWPKRKTSPQRYRKKIRNRFAGRKS